MYKLIGMDFDGTLLNSRSFISPKNQNALLKYRSDGYLIVGVTGRNLESVKWHLELSYFDYLILNNGASIYGVKKNHLEPLKTIPLALTEDLVKVLTPYTRRIDYVTDLAYYVKGAKKHLQLPFIKDIHSLDEVEGNISKINIFLEENRDIEKLFNLLDVYAKKLNIFIIEDSAESKLIVINPLNVNKGTALAYLGEKLNISLDEMIFFGDGTNDLEALEMVGMGVAMENALDVVKEKADDVTLSNDADGVACYLEKKLRRQK